MAKSFVLISRLSQAAIPLSVIPPQEASLGSTFIVAFVRKGCVKGRKLRSTEVKYWRKKEFGKGYQSFSGEA